MMAAVPGFDHAIRACRLYAAEKGSTLAAAVTYFAFLSLFPLLALAFASVGLAASFIPDAERVLDTVLRSILPGMIGDGPNKISLSAIQDAAGAVAGLGILTVTYAGLGWVSEMRDALAAMFGVDSSRKPTMGRERVVAYLTALVRDVFALIAVGLVLLVSVMVSGGLLDLVERIWRGVGVEVDLGIVTSVLLVGIGVASGTVLFFAMFKLLTEPPVSNRALWSGALLGAVGFELLKQASKLLLAWTTHQPAFQAFGIALILLVWIYYFSRIVMFAAAWAKAAR